MNQSITFAILSGEHETLKEMRSALAAHRHARVLACNDDAKQLYAEVMRLRPSAAIITLDAQRETALALISRIATECPETVIVCASRDSSPDVILRSMRAGAREFLRLPIVAEELQTVLDRTAELCAGQVKSSNKGGRVIAVFSSKGGCGVSFIATNIAAAIESKTVLVDLNLQAGDLDMFLGVDPKFTISDVVENRERLDSQLLSSYLTPHSSHLSLLAAPNEADLAERIEPAHIIEAIQFLREHHDYVVIDPPHTFDEVTLAALDQADDILLILTLDIPSIRNAQRSLALFERLGYPRNKVRIVVNRWSKHIEMELKKAEQYLGERIVGFISSDYRAAVKSINMGQPLIESQPTITLAGDIKRLASTLAGTLEGSGEAERPKGVLKSLFRRHNVPDGLNLRETLNKA